MVDLLFQRHSSLEGGICVAFRRPHANRISRNGTLQERPIAGSTGEQDNPRLGLFGKTVLEKLRFGKGFLTNGRWSTTPAALMATT
jgi:hypothetical protein